MEENPYIKAMGCNHDRRKVNFSQKLQLNNRKESYLISQPGKN